MQKKLLAAAVVSAFAAPVAFAQPANVTIYGNLQTEIFSVSSSVTGGATGTKRDSFNSISSPGVFFIGFRGQESLGGGLSAIWQVEQGAGGDGTGTSNTWGGRNTFLGLSGGFGRAYVGIMDSPLKRVLGINNVMRNGLTGPQGMNAVLNNGDTSGGDPFLSSGFGSASAFSRRTANSFNYDSPVFSGLQVMAQYGANEGRQLTSSGTPPGAFTPTQAQNPTLYGLAATWSSGPFRAGLGWQQHKDFRGAGLTDSSTLVSGSWTSGPFLVQGSWSTITYQMPNAAGVRVGDLKRDNWLIGGQYSMGAHRFRAQYQVAGDGKVSGFNSNTSVGGVVFNTAGDTGATVMHFNYGYALSKRTEVYGFYSKIDNETRGRVQGAGSAAIGLSGATAAGVDVSFVGVGIAHTF